MKRFVAALALMVFLGGSVALASAQARAAAASTPSSQPAKVTFRRIFQGSSPEYIELSIWDDQKTATYEIRQMDDDPGPAPFEVGEALRTKIFGLTAQLHNFQGQDLDVHRKIANLGEKTFRWEQAGVVHETKFNYTLNQAAAQLLQIFEGLARQQEHYELITRRMRYDRLGIYDALLQFESDLNRGLLPEPQRLVPLLEQISNDPKFVDVARQRARMLIGKIH
ncbi:MAG TPA: hypothetical protein VN749_04200 [Candidatus Eisenbacteria bacterium]|jgi:hypothetical protein|nr:hypothetical protein [Candidatus Eisenbacteria bacterium]